MNEPVQYSEAQTKKKRGLFVPIAAVIVVVAAAGFIASRAGLDKALVKQQIDNFAAQLHEKGKVQGRDLNLSYGELEVVGSFASKHVVIHDPVLSVKPLERKPLPVGEKKVVDALRITTSTIAIYPQSPDLSSLRIELNDAVDFAGEDEPAKSLLKIKSDTPVVVSIAKKKIGEQEMTEVNYQSPTQMLFTYLHEEQAAGEEEATPTVVPVYQTLQIDVAPGGGLTSSMVGDGSGVGETKVSFGNIVVTPQAAPEGAIKLAEITGNWSNVLNEKKLNAIHATFKVGPVTSDNAEAPYLPVALDFDANYEGMLTKSPESVAQVEAQESTMVLKTLSFTTKDASLTATANFKASAGDVLPVGTANIALTNVPFVLGELRKFGVLNENSEPLVTAALQQATSQPIAEMKDIVIPIERIRGGSFKIGNTTVEEIFAVFVKQAMQPKTGQAVAPGAIVAPTDAQPQAPQAPLVPQLPAADKPKAEPIAVPDPSVRG